MGRKSVKSSKMRTPASVINAKQKKHLESQNNLAVCFICDEVISGKGVPLLMANTPFSNIDLPTKIGQLMGDGFMVIVAVTDFLCKRCSSLINHLDKLECDAIKIKNALTGYLTLKYQLNDIEGQGNSVVNEDAIGSEIHDADLENLLPLEMFDTSDLSKKCLDDRNSTNGAFKYDVTVSREIKAEKEELYANEKLLSKFQGNTVNEHSCDNDDGNHFVDDDLNKEEKTLINSNDSDLYKCNSCSYKTQKFDTFLAHLKIHSKTVVFKCSECNQKFETQTDIENHITKMHGVPDILYESIRELENDPDYSPSGQKIFECTICKYRHRSKKIFEAHTRKHIKAEQYVCNICSKVFKHKITLKKHMVGHRTYKCDLCSAIFQNEVSLIHHSKVHEVEVEINGSDKKILDTIQNTDVKIYNENSCENITLENDDHTEKLEEKEIDKISDKENTVVYDQVEVLLEKMHSDVSEKEKSEPGEFANKNVKSENDVNEVKDIHVHITSSKILAQNDGVLSDFENGEQIKQFLENSVNYLDETQLSDEKEKDFENKFEGNCELLKILGDGSIVVQDSFTGNSASACIANENETFTKNIDNKIDLDNSENATKCEIAEADIKDEQKPVAKKVFVCSLCGLRTSSETHIKRHVKCHIALEKKTYRCHICERVLTTHSNLKRHIGLHESCASGEVQCNICYETLTDRLHLKHHMEMKHPELYQCSFCDQQFENKKACHEHELTHPALQCDICQKIFSSEDRLKSHREFTHRDSSHSIPSTKTFKCHICLRILTTYHNLKRHLRKHERTSGAVKCDLCEEELGDKHDLRQHVEEKHPENHQCSFCHKVFANRKSCKSHEMSHPERFVYKCDSCEKLFLTEARLKRHQDIIHRDPHCRVCGKEISNPLKLLDHERRHERHKVMFPCNQCSKVFRTPSGLKYHMSVHTGKYAVYCEICGKGLHSEVVLEEHKATHTKEVRYTCEKCGRTFSSNSTYRMHRLWHDNPLPYKCNICERKFKHTSILAVHKRRAHTGERPYKCPYCTLTFSVSSTLNKHIILHTKQYPYRCEQCGKGFTTRTKIARHMAKVHNDFEMLNSKRKTCEYKMVLHPNELSTGSKDNSEISNSEMEQVIHIHKLEDGETHTATLQVLENVTVDPSQAAIFTIFQQDLPNAEFTLHEFDGPK